jgi:dipeptidyl-peptidase-4
VKGAGKKWISEGQTNDDYLPWMEWVNNDRLGFTKMGRRQKQWDLFIANKSNGSSNKIISELDPDGWVDNHGEIYFLKDGKILWISEDSRFKHIWISKHSGSKKWALTEGSWEVSKIVHIDEKESLIYFMANKESVFEQNLYSIRLDGTELKLLTEEAGVHNIEITTSGKYFIDSFSSSTKPMKITLRELKTGDIIRVLKETEIDQFIEYEWSYPNIINFPSIDNSVTLDASIILPPNFSKSNKYPVIIHGYGMPGTQIVWNKWGKTFDQFLAQQGYIVFSMDTRGMSGRGEDFKNFSYGDMAKYLAKDQLAGIKYLESKKYVDKSRIGAWGWSGGGYFTCLMLTKNGDYFKAGVAIAPCTDFRLYDTAYTERSMGLLSENKKGYDSTSTLNWINKMKGKLLMMHGSEDDNVHSQHTTQFVNKALRANKNVVWHQYPGRNHGIYGGGARKDLYDKMIQFFRENL